MNFQTAEKRVIEILSTAKRLVALAQKGNVIITSFHGGLSKE